VIDGRKVRALPGHGMGRAAGAGFFELLGPLGRARPRDYCTLLVARPAQGRTGPGRLVRRAGAVFLEYRLEESAGF